MCKDIDFSPQITRINTDYFITKWPRNEIEAFEIKKQVKRNQCDLMFFVVKVYITVRSQMLAGCEKNLPDSHEKLLPDL
jgi:hypothetical protein